MCCLCVVCVLFVCCLCVVCVLFVCCLCEGWGKRGYAYVKDKDGPNTVYWRCERKDNLHCKGRLTTMDMKMTKVVGEHCHAPEPGKTSLAQTRDAVVARSRETLESSDQIVSSALSTASLVPLWRVDCYLLNI